jgi:hypothetical protein
VNAAPLEGGCNQHCLAKAITYEIEAEDGEGERPKEREDAVKPNEEGVEEGGDGWADENVEQNLQEPTHAEHGADGAHEELQPEHHCVHRPHVVRVLALQEYKKISAATNAANGQTDCALQPREPA